MEKTKIPFVYQEEMKVATFNRLRSLIYERSGITLGENKEALVKARISKRMRQMKITTYEDYLSCCIDDPSSGEVHNLLDAISTNVTSFYREARHFELMHKVIKDWVDQGTRSLRVWSAACSSGEEPYTIAIELSETLGHRPFDVKILATDIAPSVLKVCQEGEYSQQVVAPIPNFLKLKYFSKRKNGDPDGNIFTVKDQLRKMVFFRQFNLNTFPYPLRRPFDIIFCRNVMIYFDRPVKVPMLREFHRLLKPGGYLFVGHAESLTGMSEGFTTVEPSTYRRR